MTDPHETMFNDTAYIEWLIMLRAEAEKDQDAYYERLFQETESKGEPPF